ncbi:hypothetical protein AtNW77_Chr2g0257801 [Arabidopsis thaliana]|uniref:Transmembrane protein n=5 Tax=Arabidopsis TaxID=3701 RepID=A0A178VPT3_ARATH|nr:uncharacterized protein AT2G36724 [Arabidopsis thaliana]KAG7638742.1 hypothetical protein ISN45_At02g031460 [Arabidopsis thaliana x Arabidopsis arenosa]KAG7643352.1 hypothetical protein ISN44_As02g031690 [Arabidopsis suecica]ABF59473.1 unknown protein [Arabidopsis thaliana]AEC09291.1 transmembrane protein [Arabidopsis thaliana]OAP07728.1 hypothetical protein AXX17_AT2G33450 [Arabidopsis thaliana]|eukprot:NP_001031496.1 transmembrane protein [Arabidopsis thaliana]
MGKNLSMMLMMVMIIVAILIGGEAKSEIECSILCRPHCKSSSSAGECSDCHRKCEQSPPSVKKQILKNENMTKKYDILD